jgi:DNA polymerase-3 subunit alpha
MAFEQLHNHTEYSVLDGLTTTAEAARRAAETGSTALAQTDHGGCFGHVQHQRDCLAAGIKPIFGIETYFQPDRLARPPGTEGLRARREELLRSLGLVAVQQNTEYRAIERELEVVKARQGELRNGDHLILLAQGDKGLHDLWAASTEAYVTGFYGKPRMDWDVLEEYGSDLVCTTACLGGIIGDDVKHGRVDDVLAKLGRLKSIFPGRLYLEVQGNELADQRYLNMALAQVSEIMGIPMVATCDAHYPSEAEAALHRQWMACQSGKGKEDYWHFSPMLTEARLREFLGYLDPKVVDAAIRNTAEIAAGCTARIGGHADPPVFTPGGTADDDARALRAMCESNWGLVEGLGREYRERMEREFEVVASKGLAGCYLIVDELITFARTTLGALVGPGRGSAAGSLMSYLLGITSVDPLRAGLLFERFLTPGREALPDFDLDFASSVRAPIQDHAVERYGSDHVVRVGTIMRYGTKGIINKLSTVYEDRYGEEVIADAKTIGKLVDQAEAGTAGLGLPWDEIMQDPEITEFREKYPLLFETAEQLHGRIYAQGQHPAGLIISPGRVLTGAMPMRHVRPGDKLLVSQWDFRAAEELNLLKLDILTLRNLDTISIALDLVENRTGIRLDPRSWDIEHLDPQVYEEIGTGLTLGMFQLETRLCSDYARRMKPSKLAHLADLTTFIRPGPRNSGATEKYLARFLGAEPVEYAHPMLKDLLSGTYGVMLYQEQVMLACMILAGYSELEADGVRKILGKKLVSKVEAAGEEFTRRSAERGHDEEAMRALWADMAEFGRYAFNKCLTGDTQLHLAASSQHSNGTADLASLYRRLHAPLLPPGKTGRAAKGQPVYPGPCVACGSSESAFRFVRGLCNACRVWRSKFYDPDRGLYGLSYWADGRIRPARIIDVVAQGVKEAWKITLKDGRSITATGNHRHLTDAGYRRVDELLPGDCLVIDGGYEESRYDPERHRLTRGERPHGGIFNGPFGQGNHGFIDGGGAFWANWKRTHPKVCAQCGTEAGRIELAHLDGDHANNVEGNLEWLCASCHKAYDYAHNNRPRRWQKGHKSEAVPIESIEYVGFQETYDVVMDSPHNFVANGIVTHNSHGFSYGVLSYWTAWLKTHYPAEFLTAVMSTVDADRLPEFATEARRTGLTVLPPDVSYCQGGFTCQGITLRYGLLAVPTVGEAAVRKITAAQPYESYEDFLARSGANAGVTYALAKAGALDNLVPSRKGLVRVIESDRDGSSVRCVHKTDDEGGPGGLPCAFDWPGDMREQEERHAALMAPRLAAGKKALKLTLKLPPARCTRACRRYTPPGVPGMAAWGEYDPGELFRRDMEVYGTWMSEAVFGRLDDLSPGLRGQAREMARMLVTAAPGTYPAAAVVADVHQAVTRNGNAMWWVRLLTEVSALDLACFSPRRESEPDVPAMLHGLRAGTLVQAEVRKRSYMSRSGPRMGWNLTAVYPLG